MPFTFQTTELPGVIVIAPAVFSDDRGFLMETYKQSDFRAAGVDLPLVQENHSRSTRGTLRGLHYQCEPRAQAKLVRVVHGEIFDVAVDIRKDSATFGRWIGIALSAANRKSVFIPVGFAHGFCVTSDAAEVIYKTSAEYAPQHERGIMWDDPEIGVKWPIASPTLSDRDRRWPLLADAGVR